MTGLKTNERPGTKAVLRHYHMSASKARQVLDLIRDEEVGRAAETLRATERSAAAVVGKVLASAVANAAHNDGLDPEDLYVSACYADEGATLKRWRPRARGRATRIRKRSCHITIVVSRLPDDRLARRRAQRDAQSGGRSRRVAESRRRADLAGRLSRRRAVQEQAAEDAAAAEAAEELVATEADAVEDIDVDADDVVADIEADDAEVDDVDAVDTDADADAAVDTDAVDTDTVDAENGSDELDDDPGDDEGDPARGSAGTDDAPSSAEDEEEGE